MKVLKLCVVIDQDLYDEALELYEDRELRELMGVAAVERVALLVCSKQLAEIEEIFEEKND